MTTNTKIDLDNLPPVMNRVACAFLDDLMAGKEVSYQDYPEISEAEFTRLADAILEQVNRRH